MYHLFLDKNKKLESHRMFNSMRYVDFMIISEEYVRDNPKLFDSEFILFFDTIEEVKAHCLKHGVDWLRTDALRKDYVPGKMTFSSCFSFSPELVMDFHVTSKENPEALF